jgi:sialic acid synthase SpsE
MSNLVINSLRKEIEDITSVYSNNTIFILGKGPSIDEINQEVFKGSLCIGINDVERIAPVDITIFHSDWVACALEDIGCQARLYLTPKQYQLGGKAQLIAQYIELSQASSELVMQRLMSDEFIIEELLFISALKIAREVASIRNCKQTVYMVGFDFDLSLGYSKLLGKDYATEDEEKGVTQVSIQEFYLLNALYFLRDSSLDVKHVGRRNFSALTTTELNASLIKSYYNNAHVGRVSIVAELTTNHFGDRVRLEKMIRASHTAGANYIKLQKRDVDKFYSPEQLQSPYRSPFGQTFADYRYQLELSKDDFGFVDRLCKEIGMGWFVSVLDEPSFYFVQELGLELIKLPSTISEHKDYLKMVAESYTGNIVLSTGMTDKDYEDFVLSNFKSCEKLYLLQCNSAYPTPLHDCHIGVVRHYHDLAQKHAKVVPGYSSHDHGWKASALAVAAGARMLEKHVKLGNTEWAHFDAVAIDLTTSAFVEYVDNIRETELIMGSEVKRVNDSEHHKYFK